MDKTLSQDEVDALLQAVKSGQMVPEEEATKKTAEEVKVVTYNFRKPRLVSADQLRGFHMIHDSFAKTLQSSLFTNLKTQVEVKPVAIDNLTYGEFVLSLMNPTFIAILNTTPPTGELILEINLPIMLIMIDIMLGGTGSQTQEAREMTFIEQSIATGLVDYILAELKNAWLSTVEMNFKVASIESNPEYVQATTQDASVLNATFDLRIGEATGTMNVCYPYEMIQPLFTKISTRMSGKRAQTQRTQQDRELMLKALGKVMLDIRAQLGISRILTSQLGKLKPGDVFLINKRIDEPVEVFIGNQYCYQAQLGVRRGKLAVKLIRNSYETNGEVK